MKLHRTLLFVPGSRQEMLEKAAKYPADVLCLDLEESVLPAEKGHARKLVQTAIGSLAQAGRTVHVRVNSIQSGETAADIAAIVQPGLAGVLLAKTESARAVREIDVLLREQELAHDVKPGTVELIVAIESARGLLRCEEISAASSRLVALMLGGEDFAFDMGVERTRDAHELTHVRSEVGVCARAAGLLALDTPWADIEDIDGLVADAERARALGYSGKYLIHPNQIESVERVFSPSEAGIAYAHKLLAAWDEAVAKGDGAVQLDGRMIDRPIAERARRVVEQAEAIAKTRGRS
ncbi:MAG: CoA ester lyase [Chloroflexi bacterium]|nr:CoA ester lyase [Chloroflexota bacterium]